MPYLQPGKKNPGPQTMYSKDNQEDEGIAHCLECGEILYGRADKKFCSTGCRNAWHGHFRSERRLARSLTLNGLSRNYRILDDLLRLKQSSCPMDSLTLLGFDPELVTHQGEKRGRHIVYRCFDIAYSLSSVKLFNLHRV